MLPKYRINNLILTSRYAAESRRGTIIIINFKLNRGRPTPRMAERPRAFFEILHFQTTSTSKVERNLGFARFEYF